MIFFIFVCIFGLFVFSFIINFIVSNDPISFIFLKWVYLEQFMMAQFFWPGPIEMIKIESQPLMIFWSKGYHGTLTKIQNSKN